MTNVSDSISRVSGCNELIKGTTVFYSFPYDVETALMKGQIVMCANSEIGQHFIDNLHDSNNIILNAAEKEHKPKSAKKGMKG